MHQRATVATKHVYIPYRKSGFAHPKCYLFATKGCSEKISREHYISENLLNKIERQNITIDVCGLSWLPKEHLKSIGKSSLTANILCTQHNSDLSGLDSEIGELIEAISSIDQAFQSNVPADRVYTIDGSHIERWILKTLVGMVESRQIKQKSGDPFQYKKKCLALICSGAVHWPLSWGLYVAKSQGQIYHSLSLELLPKHNPSNGELLALAVKFNGFEMNFLMGKPDHPQEFGIHRPNKIVFDKGGVQSEIGFNWQKHKVGPTVTYLHIGTYSGLAPTHDLPRAD